MPQCRLDSACARLNFSRSLIHEYVADLAPEEWFWQPTEGVTHIAWQVGHLALVEYHLLLKRIRGERAEDAQLLHVDSYAKKYGRGSRPNRDLEANYLGDELKETLERVHAQAWAEMAAYTDELLDVPLTEPHPRFATKLEAIEFCSQHELLHAGQIALLRRLMGRPPLR